MLEKILVKEIVAPVIIVVSSILLYAIASQIVKRIFRVKTKRINEKRQKTFVGLVNNCIRYFIIAVALMMILEVYGIDTKSLVASLGVLSLVAGLALQDILKDIIVGCSIILEDQFSVGDTITIDGFTGTVVDLGLKTTRIKSYTGDIKIICNRNITEVINHTVVENNALIDVFVDYDTDLKAAREVLTELCESFSKENKLSANAECLGVEELADSGIKLRVVIPAPYSLKFSLARKFREMVKEEFAQHGIIIPYPQVVIHNGQRI